MTTDARVVAFALVMASVMAGCQPDFGAPASAVSSLRILDVTATPPEAAPGTMVEYAALVVDENGVRQNPPIDWAFCNEEKPLSDLNDIDENCFTFGASFLVEVGTGPAARAVLPQQGCSLFGPDAPPSMNMMPPGRPTDPDLTGGYYQPVRLILPDGATFVLAAEESRILCDLPAATAETQAAFKMQYQPNQNPVLSTFAALVGGQALPIGTGAKTPAGAALALRAGWNECPSPSGCGAETYAYYDPITQMLTTRREAMSLSWYATAGSFASDTTGRASGDRGTTTDNTWTAPPAPGPVTLWLVLRDDRGGSSWGTFVLDVE